MAPPVVELRSMGGEVEVEGAGGRTGGKGEEWSGGCVSTAILRSICETESLEIKKKRSCVK